MTRMLPVLLLLGGCAAGAPADTAAWQDGVELSLARYTAAWDVPDGATDADGSGFTVHTDLGWRVHVEDLRLTEATASLVACEDVVASARAARRDRAWTLVGLGSAHAGHGSTADPSATLAPVLVDLSAPGEVVLDTAAFLPTHYCRLHWATAPASNTTVGIDAAPEHVGFSLSVRATASGPHGERAAVDLDVTWSHGLLVDLDAVAALPGGGGPWTADIRLSHDLSRLFDGVDPLDDDADAIAWKLLSNVVDGTLVDVMLGSAAADTGGGGA